LPPSPPPCACLGLSPPPPQSRTSDLVDPHKAWARQCLPAYAIPRCHATNQEEGPTAIILVGRAALPTANSGGGATGEWREGEGVRWLWLVATRAAHVGGRHSLLIKLLASIYVF